jgi:hypothetical protein
VRRSAANEIFMLARKLSAGNHLGNNGRRPEPVGFGACRRVRDTRHGRQEYRCSDLDITNREHQTVSSRRRRLPKC